MTNRKVRKNLQKDKRKHYEKLASQAEQDAIREAKWAVPNNKGTCWKIPGRM